MSDLDFSKLSKAQQRAVEYAYPSGAEAFDFGIHLRTRVALVKRGWIGSAGFYVNLTQAGRIAYEAWLAEQKGR